MAGGGIRCVSPVQDPLLNGHLQELLPIGAPDPGCILESALKNFLLEFTRRRLAKAKSLA